MTGPAHLRPVGRLRVLGGAVALLAVLAGVLGLAEYLRHPPAVVPVEEAAGAGDPRDEVDCPPPPPQHRGASPVTVNSNDLYECPHAFDGRTVRFAGEVVGAVLRRSGGAWVQLNDDAYAGDLGPLPAHRDFRGGNAGVGVHLPPELAGAVTWVGGPAARGDVLTVVGVYHLSDAASGEVAIIRASRGAVTGSGEPITHEPLPDRKVAGVVLVTVAVALLAAGRVLARRDE